MTNIPIISITGTNGKTTTARMVSNILMNQGYKVGVTTTHGIYLNGQCIRRGDCAGPKSALRVLEDPGVEFAVLETARGGIIRKGLVYGKADVAVFTNLTEDHLGLNGIKTMDDLWNIKCKVIEAVKDNGVSVLNADDPWVMKSLNRARGKILLFGMDRNNPHLQNWINKGDSVLYTEGDSIYLSSANSLTHVIKIDQIPATLKGALKHNIYNSMASIGATLAADVPINIIRSSLESFDTTPEINPGRFNIYDLGEFKVILDFGHNIDGYRVTLEGLRNLKPERLTGIVGLPGNRRNEDMWKVGYLAGKYFDRLIIREDKKLRGRQPYEAGTIIRSGAIAAGMHEHAVEIIPDENIGLLKLMTEAQKGDIIAVFYDKIIPITKIIDGYRQILLQKA